MSPEPIIGPTATTNWMDHLPEAALLVDAGQDLIVAANSAMGRMVGTNHQSLTGTPCTPLFTDQRPQLIAFTEETLFRNHAWSQDFTLNYRDGHTVELEISSSRVGEAESQTLLLLLRDRRQLRTLRERHDANHYHRGGLLEWRRVEELFKDMERENQLILHAVGEGIYGVNAEGRTTFANPAAERMLGWRIDELMGRVIHRVVHHSHEDGSLYPLKECPIYAAFRDASVKRVGEDWFWRKDGTGFSVEYTSTPILDNGHPVGAVVVFRDITPRLQAQKELQNALEEVESLKHRLEMENAYLQEEINSEFNHHQIIGNSVAVQHTIQQIELVAPTDATVLIHGESGTGKELIARAIHEMSLRCQRSLIRVNCAAIPAELFESEFFGHIKGAFTGASSDRAGRFELADGGTLFLDEVGEIPLHLQGKLLRVLQEKQFERIGEAKTREVDVRIIAATNRNLHALIKAGKFREDLYYRLNVFPIESVPLRQRKEDMLILTQHFLTKSGRRINKNNLKIPMSEIDRLCSYDWPGNIRELENVIERQAILSRDGILHFKDALLPVLANHAEAQHTKPVVVLDDDLKHQQKSSTIEALSRCKGKIFGQDGAANLLGVKPTTLASRIKKFEIDTRQFKKIRTGR